MKLLTLIYLLFYFCLDMGSEGSEKQVIIQWNEVPGTWIIAILLLGTSSKHTLFFSIDVIGW
jgi:hypothetical protein